MELPDYQTEYLDAVTYKLLIPEEQTDAVIDRVTKITAAKAKITVSGTQMGS